MKNVFAVDTLGMIFIGTILATWLFGANTLQTYIYFQKYNDSRLLKAVVYVVFISDMLNSIFIVWGLYVQLVRTSILPVGPNIPLVLESTASDVVIFVVQCFFAQSVYKVSRHNKWLTGVILGLATIGFISGIGITISSIVSLSMLDKPVLMVDQVGLAVTLGSITLTDLVITVSLLWFLYDGKSTSGPTSKLLDGLIMYCVQRGILTTVSHVIVLVLWYTLPQSAAWSLFQLSLGKVYTLTFLTLLNRRDSLKQADNYRAHEHVSRDTLGSVQVTDLPSFVAAAPESDTDGAKYKLPMVSVV